MRKSRAKERTAKRNKTNTKIVSVLILILAIVAAFVLWNNLNNKKTNSTKNLTNQSSSTSSSEKKKSSSSSKSDLPNVKVADWDLVLVNRENKKAELNPILATVGNIQVDSRIAAQLEAFLAAAQQIDVNEHLISGYRSVAYQEQIYNQYVQNEMAGLAGSVNATGQPISQAEAEKNVQTYSQPAGASEHQTGLAVDISTVDNLNESSPEVVKKIVEIAPQYGFVLRFPEGKQAETGVGYEDWHFRYVGVENAKYMTKHQLTLEAYIKLLTEQGKN